MRGTEYANKEMTIHSDPQLNDADLELLSAYIDRQLDDDERAALERRLSQEPLLRGVLDELRATVGMLHELEPLRPPRSFAIAAPAPAPRRFWSFQWPAIASALVALICVLTFSYALIRSSSGESASAPSAAMQEAAAPTAAAAAAGGAPPDSAMRQAATTAPAAAAPMAAAAPTAAPAAEAPAAPMAAADAPTAAPAAAAPMATQAPAATATMMASSGAGALATAQLAAEAQPAADSAAPTAAAAEAPVSSALQGTAVPAQEPYNALVATSEISSPGTVTLDQPPIAPTANSAPTGRSSNTWLVAGVVVLVLLIAVGIGLALRRSART